VDCEILFGLKILEISLPSCVNKIFSYKILNRFAVDHQRDGQNCDSNGVHLIMHATNGIFAFTFSFGLILKC